MTTYSKLLLENTKLKLINKSILEATSIEHAKRSTLILESMFEEFSEILGDVGDAYNSAADGTQQLINRNFNPATVKDSALTTSGYITADKNSDEEVLFDKFRADMNRIKENNDAAKLNIGLASGLAGAALGAGGLTLAQRYARR